MVLAEFDSANSSDTGPSGKIWGNCPVLSFIADPSLGFHFFDSFNMGSTFASATAQQGYITYQDTGVTIKPLATDVNGVLQIAGADADNDEGSIQAGATTCVMGKISSTTPKRMWFEARIANASAALTDSAFFVGLAEEGTAIADILVNDTGVLKTTADFIGFRTLCASPSELDAVYQKASQTPVEVDDNCATVVASTYMKLGFKFDLNDHEGKAIRYYVNGVEVPGYVAKATISASTFPDGEELAPLIALKAGEAVEKKFNIDWIRFAQER